MSEIVKIIIGGIIGFLGAIFISIKSDILPVVLPSLKTVPIICYLKIIVLLITLILLLVILIIFLYLKSRLFVPVSGKGKFYGVLYEYHIDSEQYNRSKNVIVRLDWICPKHTTALQKNYETVEKQSIQTLYCNACKKYYPIIIKGSRITPDEACNHISNIKIYPKINLLSK